MHVLSQGQNSLEPQVWSFEPQISQQGFENIRSAVASILGSASLSQPQQSDDDMVDCIPLEVSINKPPFKEKLIVKKPNMATRQKSKKVSENIDNSAHHVDV